jgi:hypothetical protein
MKRLAMVVLGPLVLGPLGACLASQSAQAAPSNPITFKIGPTAVISTSQILSLKVAVNCDVAFGTPLIEVTVQQPQALASPFGFFTGQLPCTGQWQTVEISFPAPWVPGKAFASGNAANGITGGGVTASASRQISLSS